MNINDEYLSPAEIAERLKLNRTTVYALIRRGELPFSKVGKQVRVLKSELDGYIASKKIGSLAELGNTKGVVRDQLSSPGDPPSDAARNGTKRSAIIIAGQDRSLDLLVSKAAGARRKGSPQLLRSQLGSYNGLTAMYIGKTTACGAHLWDAETDTYNVPYVKRLLPGVECGIVRIAGRRQGLYVQHGNPKKILSYSDILSSGAEVVNRERGSGTRVLTDQKFNQLGIDTSHIRGYDRELSTHMSVIGAVVKGEADVGFGCESDAAAIDSVEFIPLVHEWLDFVYLKSEAERPLLALMLDWLSSADFRRELEVFGVYDISQTGRLIDL